MSDTVLGALATVAERERGALVFHDDEDEVHRYDSAQILEIGSRTAAALGGRGVEPGDGVGLLGPNDAAWAGLAFGVWSAGATLVPLQFPLRVRDRRALGEQIASLLRAVPCRSVLAHPTLQDVLPDDVAVSWTSFEGAVKGGDTTGAAPDDVAVAQFTSGTTAAPKAALITHRAIMGAVRTTAVAFGLTDEDVYAGWQPFFHDLGLFGLLLRPLLLGLEAHFISTARFARDPAGWFRLAGRAEATMLAGPSSALAAAARAADRDPRGCDLGSVRMATFSAETIEPAAAERFLAVGRRFGLRASALSGAYGMAETTLGVTVTRPGEGLRFDDVDLTQLAETGKALPARTGPVRRVASCGVPVPEAEVIVAGADGRPLPERTVGAILTRGPSLFSGYRGGVDEDAFTPDGWLRTGDLGYVADGELFFTGREKDVVVVLGRNHDPDDLEWAAGRVDGVRTGRCVAVPGDAEGSVTVVVEPRQGADVDGLPTLVRRAVIDAIGVSPTRVLVVPPGTVLKTTSGKLRRGAVRERLDEMQVLAAWPGPGQPG